MDEWRWLAWIVGIFVVLRLLPRFLAIPQLLRIRLQPGESRRIERASVPDEVASWLEAAAEPFLKMGFEFLSFVETRDFLDGGDYPEVHLVLRHPETGTFATLVPGQVPDHRLPCRIDLETPLADGRLLLTLNTLGYAMVGSCPSLVVHDPHSMTEPELWTAHRERVEALGGHEPRILDLERFFDRGTAISHEVLNQLEAAGDIERDASGERFKLRLRSAARLARQFASGSAARERFLKERGGKIADGSLSERRLEVWQEVDAYLRSIRALEHPIDGSALAWILVFSGGAFFVAMWLIFGAVGALALLGVVALHELGHYAAMRLLGYKDTSVFFVPFLGAATTGQKQDVSVGEEMVVLLAGPLPGIALGVGLLLFLPGITKSQEGAQLIGMLIAINVLNLMPVMPLDGGKALERLVLMRRPWWSLGVGVVGIGAFGALAVWSGDWVLIVFCGLFAFALRAHFKGMKLLARVRREAPDAATPEHRAWAVFRVLEEQGALSFPQKVQLARLVEAHWSQPLGGRWTRLGWLVGYGACLVGSVGGVVAAIAA